MSTLVSTEFTHASKAGSNTSRPFEEYASQLVANGWSIFPQTAGSERHPGIVAGEMIAWTSEHDLANRLPTRKALRDWITYCADHNVAGVMGPASGYTLAIDIDITDPQIAAAVTAIAFEVFGKTPFRRVGRAPKVALIYRRKPEDSIPNRRRPALDGGHAIDILSDATPLTFYGRHHLTGLPFKWQSLQPTLARPERAPIITNEMLDEFFFEVDRVMPLQFEHLTSNGDELNISFVEDGNGKVIDGRESLLAQITWQHGIEWKRQNPTAAATDEVVKKISVSVAESFTRKAVMNGRWTTEYLKSQTLSRVRRLLGKSLVVKAANINRKRLAGEVDRSSRTTEPFRYWAQREIKDPQPLNPPSLEPIIAQMRTTFREFLDTANRPVRDLNIRLGAKVVAHDDLPPIVIMKAEPGFGKTSTIIEMIASDPATYQNISDEDGRLSRFPFLMLVPTYRNADELRSRAAMFNLDHTASDEDLVEAAANAGLIKDDFLPIHLEQIRQESSRAAILEKNGGHHFRVELYQGRLRAGCLIPEQMGLVSGAGIAGSSLCVKRKPFPQEGEDSEEFCDHYHACPAIAQRQIFSEAHLVIMPHAFLALPIPEEAKLVRAVIVDERAHDLFLHTTNFPIRIFNIVRKDAAPLKSEYRFGRANGMSDQEVRQEVSNRLRDMREGAAFIALRALREGKCPASVLSSTDPAVGLGMEALHYVRSAKRLCAASMQRETALKPNMTVAQVELVINAPTGEFAREEWRFWSIIEDRISALLRARGYAEQLIAQRAAAHEDDPTLENGLLSLDEAMQLIPDDVQPRGRCELRIQLRRDPEDQTGVFDRIRISWRSVPNWLNRPLLLLDASAAPEIIAKIWNRPIDSVRQYDLTEPAKLYERLRVVLLTSKTYANNMLAGSEKAAINGLIDQEPERLDHLRKIISWLSVKHGDGRVVVGTTMMLRRLINTLWMSPGNMDWCHYGALRGLDAFKRHAAALSIGRIEVPIEIVDGIAAALTYDDPVPQEPYDKLGTGITADKRPLMLEPRERTFLLRNGEPITLTSPSYPDSHKWCQLLQKQYREEEIIQFLGRLRVFHRPPGEIPVWYAMSSVLPDGVIIDEIGFTDLDQSSNGSSQRGSGEKDEISALIANIIRQNYGVINLGMTDACPPLDINDAWRKIFSQHGLDFDARIITSPLLDRVGQLSDDGPYSLKYTGMNFILPPEDKIDLELSSPHMRRAAEIEALNKIFNEIDVKFDPHGPWSHRDLARTRFAKKEPELSNGVEILKNLARAEKLSRLDKLKQDIKRTSRTLTSWLALAALEQYWMKTRFADQELVNGQNDITDSMETVDFSKLGDLSDPLEFVGDVLFRYAASPDREDTADDKPGAL